MIEAEEILDIGHITGIRVGHFPFISDSAYCQNYRPIGNNNSKVLQNTGHTTKTNDNSR